MSARPTQQFVKGQTIVTEGSQGDRTFKIISGEVVVCKQNSEANLVPIAKLGAGEIFGEMYLFEQTKSRSATVIAASSDVLVEVLFQDEVEHLMNRIPAAVGNMLQGFTKRLRLTSHNYAETLHERRMSRLPDGTLKPSGTSIYPLNPPEQS